MRDLSIASLPVPVPPKKIGHIHLNLSTESGDTRMCFNIARNMQKAGHQVTLYTAQFDPKCFRELHGGLNVKVVPVPRLAVAFRHKGIFQKIFDRVERERWYTKAAHEILRALPRDLDILICQNDQSYKLGIQYKKINLNARIVWIMNNAPFRHTKKDGFVADVFGILASVWGKWIIAARYVQGIDLVVVHDRVQEKLLRGLGVRVVNLPIPIDFENFYLPPKIVAPEKEIILLGVGSLSPARKFEDIIVAAGILRKKGVHARVIVVSKDFWKDAAYREFLERIARENNMAGLVEFHFDGATERELHAILAKAHFYVFPNHIKIWSMSSFEAMAAGIPLVVSRVTSVAEVLTDGEHALFCEPGDPNDIAAKIKSLVDAPVRYRRIAVSGQSFVRTHLVWRAYREKFLDAACAR